MNAVVARYENGQIVLSQPVNWPDGTDVVVEPLHQARSLGIPEDEWPTDAEGIARLLARMDAIEPFQMAPEEEGEWQAARQAQREHEQGSFNQHAEDLRRMWD